MTKRFICLLIAMSIMRAASLFAQGGAAAPMGTLMLEKKTYALKHALAYETTIDDEGMIAVVLSSQAVSGRSSKEVRDAEKEGNDGDFNRPFLKLVFKKTANSNIGAPLRAARHSVAAAATPLANSSNRTAA